MRRFYIGAEIAYDLDNLKTVLIFSSRAGKVKRWVDAGVPNLDKGRIRIGLLMPLGFRFAKDKVASYSSKADHSIKYAKLRCALAYAEGKYIPHAKLLRKKTETEEVQAEG